MEVISIRPPEPSLPAAYWSSLTQDDRAQFLKLRSQLHQAQKTSVKDSRLVSFSNEMSTILSFLERTEEGHEQRAIVAGVAFAGPFICVNTRQLKSFLGRCKSSINGSLQQLGYVAVRTKSKARTCVLAVMPSLASEPNLLRQWTVRGASDEAQFCFVSRFQPSPMPIITADDLNEDKKRVGFQPSQVVKSAPVSAKSKYDYDLSLFRVPDGKFPEMTPSYSMDCLADEVWEETSTLDRFAMRAVPRSQSAYFTGDSDWPIVLEETYLFDY